MHISDMQLKWFHFKDRLLHCVLPTNTYLFTKKVFWVAKRMRQSGTYFCTVRFLRILEGIQNAMDCNCLHLLSKKKRSIIWLSKTQ